MLSSKKNQRGDTIIEVLIAVTVFSLVAVGGLSIMNQGSSLAQRSLEITLTRQQIDAQADTLRFLHDSYVASYRGRDVSNYTPGTPAREWAELIQRSIGSASDFSRPIVDGGCPTTMPTGGFILNTNTAQVVTTGLSPSIVHAQVRYDNDGVLTAQEGIWVEAVRRAPTASTPGYYDFHIRACWYAPGQSNPMLLGTIVRLYEPGS